MESEIERQIYIKWRDFPIRIKSVSNGALNLCETGGKREKAARILLPAAS